MLQTPAAPSAHNPESGKGKVDGQALDVLDLPQLYTKPSVASLLHILSDLYIAPRSWSSTVPVTASMLQNGQRRIIGQGVPGYLTKIIASPLAWIEDEAERERIWEVAAARLSERGGRMAMGAMSRTFEIPLTSSLRQLGAVKSATVEGQYKGRTQPVEEATGEGLRLTIHEPALTSDNMGLKTWASSHLLAQHLSHLLPLLPPHLPDSVCDDITTARVLELGAGTGLLGLAAAALLKACVLVTDLNEIVPNLERNIQCNATYIARHGGQAEVAVLDWSCPASVTLSARSSIFSTGKENGREYERPAESSVQSPYAPHSFSLILAADPVYSPEHPRLFTQAVEYHLCRAQGSRVVVGVPVREGFQDQRGEFRVRMERCGLQVLQEGELTGVDDWGTGDDQGEVESVTAQGTVRCSWTVWGWR